jgi:hypothetical protein
MLYVVAVWALSSFVPVFPLNDSRRSAALGKSRLLSLAFVDTEQSFAGGAEDDEDVVVDNGVALWLPSVAVGGYKSSTVS